MAEKKYYHVYGYRTATPKSMLLPHILANDVHIGEVDGTDNLSALRNAKKKFGDFTIKKVSLQAEYR